MLERLHQCHAISGLELVVCIVGSGFAAIFVMLLCSLLRRCRAHGIELQAHGIELQALRESSRSGPAVDPACDAFSIWSTDSWSRKWSATSSEDWTSAAKRFSIATPPRCSILSDADERERTQKHSLGLKLSFSKVAREVNSGQWSHRSLSDWYEAPSSSRKRGSLSDVCELSVLEESASLNALSHASSSLPTSTGRQSVSEPDSSKVETFTIHSVRGTPRDPSQEIETCFPVSRSSLRELSSLPRPGDV